MSLYHKYRPTELSQVRGNEELVHSLERMLAVPKKFPHAILMHGETGCGKTTIGRIISDVLGCVGDDYTEINSSDFRGIDTVRELIRSSQYAPTRGKCKVYLIDECHKMTNDAQNAMLKILEDTPSHIYFILCTTEVNKLISAIRGRCQEFQVKVLSDEDMKGLLRFIVKSEKEKLNTEIYEQIVQDSMGHPRNAINVLEKVLAADPAQRLAVAKKTADTQSQAIELARILTKPRPNWNTVNKILKGLKDQEPEGIRRVVLGYAQAILLNKYDEQCGLVLECFMEPNFTNGFPQLVYNCLQICKG